MIERPALAVVRVLAALTGDGLTCEGTASHQPCPATPRFCSERPPTASVGASAEADSRDCCAQPSRSTEEAEEAVAVAAGVVAVGVSPQRMASAQIRAAAARTAYTLQSSIL